MADTMHSRPSNLAAGSSQALKIDTDLFESLLNLEETFYNEGHVLGSRDGAQQGLVEGRVFGMERGFDKFAEMARLHGHSTVLGNRIQGVMEMNLPARNEGHPTDPNKSVETDGGLKHGSALDLELASCGEAGDLCLEPLPTSTARLEKHIRTLYALTEPASLSLRNDEDDVSEFDDRFKRAQAKATILGKMVGYDIGGADTGTVNDLVNGKGADDGDGGKIKGRGQSDEASIEDVGILNARY